MSNIFINARSSIRIEGTKVIYFDPFKIIADKHDAEIIFVTHEHYVHFSPEDINFATQNGVKPITLGTQRLRTETAAVVAADMVSIVNNL